MKGRKEIEQIVQNSEYRDLLTENENILKSYVIEKSIFPKLKRDSKINSINRSFNRKSIFRTDTVSAMNNLIHQKTFLNEIKSSVPKKGKPKYNQVPMSPPSGNKKVTFSEFDENSFTNRPFSNDGRNLINSLNSEGFTNRDMLLSSDKPRIKYQYKSKAMTKLKKDFEEFSRSFLK